MPSYTQYKQVMFAFDNDDNIERWITVNGNHIPIHEGESAYGAIQNWINNKKGNIEGKGYAETVKHYNSSQHALAAKEYESLAKNAYKRYEKSGYEDINEYERHEGYIRRYDFHKEQEKQTGIKELQKRDNYADYSVPELTPDDVKKIYKANFNKGGINVYELKPEIWEEIKNLFSKEDLNKKMDWNISGPQKFETILKNTLRPEARATSERIYDIGREWGVDPKKVHAAFMRMRKI